MDGFDVTLHFPVYCGHATLKKCVSLAQYVSMEAQFLRVGVRKFCAWFGLLFADFIPRRELAARLNSRYIRCEAAVIEPEVEISAGVE
jgi:hypothetical protein